MTLTRTAAMLLHCWLGTVASGWVRILELQAAFRVGWLVRCHFATFGRCLVLLLVACWCLDWSPRVSFGALCWASRCRQFGHSRIRCTGIRRPSAASLVLPCKGSLEKHFCFTGRETQRHRIDYGRWNAELNCQVIRESSFSTCNIQHTANTTAATAATACMMMGTGGSCLRQRSLPVWIWTLRGGASFFVVVGAAETLHASEVAKKECGKSFDSGFLCCGALIYLSVAPASRTVFAPICPLSPQREVWRGGERKGLGVCAVAVVLLLLRRPAYPRRKRWSEVVVVVVVSPF